MGYKFNGGGGLGKKHLKKSVGASFMWSCYGFIDVLKGKKKVEPQRGPLKKKANFSLNISLGQEEKY